MEQAGFNNNDVIAACTILAKKDQDNNELKKAEKYLIAFQKSPQSWTISCEILAMENMHVDVLAQVAIFLKQKFQYDFFQLPQDEYVNLAKLLIRFMLNHFHSSITSQLSLGLVLLYMHTFESLGDLIDILGQTLFTAEKKEGLALDVIKLMPEVSYDNKVIVNNKQRDQYTKFLLNKEAPKVFEILENLGKNENLGGTLKYKILDVFQEWFYFARKNQGVIDNIHDHSCFALALNSMSDSLLAEKARSSINTIIKAVRRPEEHPKIFEAIFKYIFEYMKDCNEVLKTDVDHALEYTKVFRSFGIKFSRTMIESPNEGLMKILQYIIELTANQKLYTDVLIELEEFWEEFSNDFARVIKNNQYPGKIEEFAEVFKLLIQITVTRIQMNEEQLLYIENKAERRKYYEDDNDDDDNEDDAVDQDLREIEDKQDERRLCRNILLDVQDIIGFSNTFSTIFDTLRELIAKVQENNINWDNLGWDLIAKFECIMYTAKSCIISNKTKELPDLTEFFQLVMPIKLKSVKANRTKIELIEYAAEKAIMSEEIMSSMFTYLAENLKDPRTAADAGIALIDLCENCSGFVIKNFESFLELRQQFENNDDLVIGLAVAIAHDRQTQARERYLALLCTPFAERIVKYMDMWDNDQSEDLAIDIKSNLKKLTMIFGKMPILEEGQTENSNHPLEPVLVELWPIFKNAFKKFYTHTRILVNLCNVIKKCLRTLTIKFKPFLLEYLELVCEIFPLHPLADFLYAIEVSASIFGKDEEMIPTLTKVYEYVSSATLNFINDKDMRDHDELLEDFFGMLFRYIKYLPQVVLYSNTLEINLHLAELAIGVDQPNIEKTLFLFLEVLFQMCSYNPKDDIEKAMTEIIVNKYGAIYTKKLIREFTFYPQERLRKYIRDIIFGSFVHLKEHTLQWLEMCLSADVSDNILTPAEKEDMLRSLQKIDVNKPKRRSDDTESDSEEESTWSVREDFKELFEFFEYRCKLVDRRNYKLEKA